MSSQSSDHSKGTHLVKGQKLGDWCLRLTTLERLLSLARRRLAEAGPYVETAQAGIADVNTLIEACAGISAQLSWEIIDVDTPDEA